MSELPWESVTVSYVSQSISPSEALAMNVVCNIFVCIKFLIVYILFIIILFLINLVI